MTNLEQLPIEQCELRMGQEMNVITFGELIKELIGEPFKITYKGYISQGESNEKSDME